MPDTQRIGLIAGSGELPLHFAKKADEHGYSVIAAAMKGSASPRISRHCREIAWISPGQLGALISFLRKNGVKKVVMLGKVQHSLSFRNLRMDWKALALWAKLKNRSGESLLKAVAQELQKNGIRVIDSRFLMNDVLCEKGWIAPGGSGKPGRGEIRYGLNQARRLARMGLGQSVVIKKNAVVSLEGMEGTDEAILRAGKLAGPGTILVKVASPRQDWRFDIPTIGLKTLKCLSAVKARGLVVESGRTFMLEKDKVKNHAKKSGLFILAV